VSNLSFVNKYTDQVKSLSGNPSYVNGKYIIVLPDFMSENDIVSPGANLITNKGNAYQNQFGYAFNVIEEFVSSANIVNSLDVQIGPNKTTYVGNPGVGYVETLDFIIPPSTNFYIHVDAFNLVYESPNLVNVPTTTNLQYSEITSGISVQLSYTGNAGFPAPVVPLDTNYAPGGAPKVLVRARIQFTSIAYISSLVILTNP